MKNKLVLVTFIISISLFSINILANGNIKWHSFDEGMEKAKTENKVLLVDFYTEWCGWCKKMDQSTYTDPKVVDYLNKNFVAVKLNPEKDGNVTYKGDEIAAYSFSQSAGVSGFPATGFFTSNEDFMGVVPGYLPPNDFLDLLGKVVDLKDKKPE